ncbi:MAG: PAS domain-containing protein, partial [Thermoguttaceae bacterium]|nr:PAS domain-containing protein [Thermoguttaceae bacterium]
RRKELQRSLTKWNAAARIAKIRSFQMHVPTRRVCGDADLLGLFWRVENGVAAPVCDWVCPEDAPVVEKAHDDFANGLNDHFWVNYRVIQNGVTRYFVCYAVRDADDPDMMVGIVHDVTETKEAESQRDTVQQLWKNVIDHSPVMMFVKAEDDDFRYIKCNRDFAALVGRSPEEVVGRTDAELFNRPQDAQEFREIDRQVMASGRPRKFQESAQDVHGQLRHIQTVKMSIKDANGQMLLIGMSMDVTELKNSRDEAQKHEEMFRLTIQSIGDGVLITDEHGSIQLLNPVAEHLIGMSSAQAKGKPHEEVFRIVNLSSDTPVVSPLVKALTSGEIAELGSDADLLSFDGNRYHIADCAGPIRNLNNEIIGAVMIFRDITGEYKYREELRDSVALWNLTADIAKLMPFRMHIPTRQVLGDVERLRQYWPIVDGKAVLPKDWICAEDCEQVDREYEKFAAGEIDRFLATYRVICDGKTRYYRRYAVRDAKDADVMVGIIQDITLDKELEYERDSSRALWEQVVEAMPILMFVKSADDDFRYVQCNDNFANYIGRPKAEIVGHTDMEFIPCQEEKEHFRLWDDKIMAEGKVQEFYEESQGAHKYYHFQTVKMPFTDARGKRLLIGLAVDISSGKKAEEERNAARTLLNNAFAAMPIILYIKAADRDFRYIQCNDNFCKLFGKTESEILGHTDEEIFCRPQEVKVFRDADITVMETGKPIDIIETLSGSDNKTYHFRAVKMSGTNFDGERILIGMSVDITELVEQREQIQASRNQLQVGCRMTRCFTFELGEDRQISTTNGLFKELIPHVDGKALSPEEWVVPEDIQITLRKLEVFYEKQIGEIAVNFRTDWFGKRRYYKCVLTRDGDHVYGVTSDVTELVEASEEVKESSLMWKRVMDELPVRFFVKDVDNDCRYIMCNKANADFFGLPEKAFVGKTTEEVCKPSHAIAKYLADEQRILQDRTVSHMRISMPDAHGIICDMEKIEMPITGPKNRSLLIGIAFDVTEREQSLRLAEICAQILARVVDEPDFSKVLDHIGEATTGILNCRRVIFAKCDDEGALRYLQDTDVDPNYHVSKQSIALHEHYWSLYVDRLRRNELVKFERMGNDVLLEPLFEHHPEYRNMALIGTPILENDQLYGVMIISFPGPHVFTEYEVRTLRAICNCILMAANRSRQTQALLQAQEEQAWQLAERTALNECLAIFMASDYMDVPFKEILDSIRSYLGASHCYVMLFDSEKKQATALAEASAAEDHPFLMGAPPLAFDQNSLWFTELKEKYVVGWPDFTADEARARLDSSWPAIEEVYQVRSLWVAALETNEKIQGALGIVYGDDSKKTFRLQDESFVRSAARVVSLIMTRVQHRNELITALETQLDTAECLRYMVGDEDVLVAIRHLLDIIRKHTGADVAFMAELNEDSDAARTWGKLTMDSNFSDSDVSEVPFGPNEEWYLLLKQDKPLHIEDTAKTAADDILGSWAFLLHGDYPMRSCYEIPIYCDGHLWGAVGIMYAKATPLSQNNADFMTNAKKFFEILLSRQESRQKLDVAAKRAQAAEQAKSFFLASMSHEIRTPLNAVIGFTEILKDSEMADETQAEYIDNIHVASNALLRLINDILDLSKLEAGQMQLIPERINFPAFCKEICRTFQYVAKQKNVQLDVMIDEDMPPLMVDQIRMRQIFFNLIGNAVKFTPEEGRVTVSVEFSRLSFSAGSLLLKFADTGIGMSEADQKKIFEPFVQLS